MKSPLPLDNHNMIISRHGFSPAPCSQPMDYHEHSLRLYEQHQEQELQTDNRYETWFVVTSEWEQQAMDPGELKELIGVAVLSNLTYTIETIPF